MIYKCPKCGQTETFETIATIHVRLNLVGDDYVSELVPYTDRYHMDNKMMCLACEWPGRIANFYIEDAVDDTPTAPTAPTLWS